MSKNDGSKAVTTVMTKEAVGSSCGRNDDISQSGIGYGIAMVSSATPVHQAATEGGKTEISSGKSMSLRRGVVGVHSIPNVSL